MPLGTFIGATGLPKLDFFRVAYRGGSREENIPTKQSPSGPQAWISPAHVNPGRTSCHRLAPPQGTSPPERLIHRITQRSHFDLLRTQSIVVRKGRVWIRICPLGSLTNPQVAYALGRKNGNAAHRNRIRRKLREQVRMFDVERGLPPALYLIGLSGRDEPSMELFHSALRAAADRVSEFSNCV